MKNSKNEQINEIIRTFLDGENRHVKGLYSLYNHIFYILAGNKEENVTALIDEMKNEIGKYGVNGLPLKNIDIMYVSKLIGEELTENQEKLQTYVQLFAMMKWFYRNNRMYLENGKLYRALSTRKGGTTVILESDEDTHDKLRLMLKTIKAEPRVMQEVLGKTKMLPSYRAVMISLYGILRNMKSRETSRQFEILLKSEEMCCIIQAVFDKFCDVDIMNNFSLKVDVEGLVMILTELLILSTQDSFPYCKDIEVMVKTDTDLTVEELELENKNLKARYKELRLERYQLEKEQRKQKEIAIELDDKDLEEEIEMSINEKIYRIDFGLSLQEKKEILSSSKFLLLKSDDVKIVSVMNNVRVESIYTVAPEVLKSDYDAVIVLTKSITHGEVYRVKAMIGDTPLIYTSRTNRRLIIEDIYNQY